MKNFTGPAIQYDFYIPKAIWEIDSVKIFRERLLSVESGGTVFNDLVGVWQGETEETRIYRLIKRADQFQRRNLDTVLRQEIEKLLAKLARGPQPQQAFMYTVTKIELNMMELKGNEGEQ